MTLPEMWTDRCSVNDCGRGCKRRLMCSSHWRLVPDDARRALRDGFEALRRGPSLPAARDAVIAASARCIHAAEVHPRG